MPWFTVPLRQVRIKEVKPAADQAAGPDSCGRTASPIRAVKKLESSAGSGAGVGPCTVAAVIPFAATERWVTIVGCGDIGNTEHANTDDPAE